MNRKIVTILVLLVFVIGMLCAVDTVSAKKPVAKVKKNKKYVIFKYKGHKYKAKLKKNYYDKYAKKHRYHDTVTKIKGKKFRLYYDKDGESGSSRYLPNKGWNFCKLRSSSGDSHLYYKVKFV